jgi:hypothetical protein
MSSSNPLEFYGILNSSLGTERKYIENDIIPSSSRHQPHLTNK